MPPRPYLTTPAILSLTVSSIIGIILFGGCPQPQVPNQVPDQNDQAQLEPNATTPTTPGRPIPPPPFADQGTTGGGTTGGTGEGTSGGTTEGSTATDYTVRFTSPLTPLGVRPGTKVNLTYKITDPRGLVASVEFVTAYADPSGAPTGDAMKVSDLSVATGTQTVTFDTQYAKDKGWLNKGGKVGYGQFLLGLRTRSTGGDERLAYASGVVTIDDVQPSGAWIRPDKDLLVSPGKLNVQFTTTDNSRHTARIFLDSDQNPDNGYAGVLLNETAFDPGTATTHSLDLDVSISAGTYYYLVVLSDGIDPPTKFYAPDLTVGGTKLVQLAVTNRLVGTFDLNRLDPDATGIYDNDPWTSPLSKGCILQGFNANDLAGTSMVGVKDLNGDGKDELVVVARFGKPRVIGPKGVGWGEGYLVLGQSARLREPKRLNAVGELNPGGIKGLVFTGIRAPAATSWSEGLSDVTVIPDMDGDNLPDLVFSFPRVESISLGNTQWQYGELAPYHLGMGALEYDPAEDQVDTLFIPGIDLNYFNAPTLPGWLKNRTQFTRGGIVIVSSSNAMFESDTKLNAKGNRIIDLHETGQCFSPMGLPIPYPMIYTTVSQQLVKDCSDDPNKPKPTQYEDATVYWDLLFDNQGPEGFDNWVTKKAFWNQDNPPIANMWAAADLDWMDGWVPRINDPCGEKCVLRNRWLPFTPCNNVQPSDIPGSSALASSLFFPVAPDPCAPETAVGFFIHTGFYGFGTAHAAPWDTTVGARVLGQRVNDRFGTAVSADGTWLYMSAPQHTARPGDVPDLPSARDKSGVVYQLRTNTPAYVGGPTRSQLWIEPGDRFYLDPNKPNADPNDPNNWVRTARTWPYPDAHRTNLDPNKEYMDYAMPVPHTYIIEDVGSHRHHDVFWQVAWTDWLKLQLNQWKPEIRQALYRWKTMFGGTGASCVGKQLGKANPADRYLGVPTWYCEWPTHPAGGVGTAEWTVSQVAQIVGPHPGAQIGFVRAVGDVDGDLVEDFAVGSAKVRADIFGNDPNVVGAVFIVFGRPPGLEGDYLLERLAAPPGDPNRLAGVVLKGNSPAEPLARVFDKAGYFNNDIFGDVVVGNEHASGGRGEAVVLLGSRYLQSPAGGWTVNAAVAANACVRFVGEAVGDQAGANVAYAGDVDGDGYGDIMIAAPGAAGGRGAVYLIYGSSQFTGGQTISLSAIGTFALQGVKFTGRNVGDALGGGRLAFGDGDPNNPNGNTFLNPNNERVDVYSRGMVSIGDLDGDGKGDIAISAMLADPLNRYNAGEVYVIYGRGN